MTVHDLLPPTDDLLHSHSDLTRQVEELEAHARALKNTEDEAERADVLADLIDFATRFVADCKAHIAEEEEVLFPSCHPHLTASTRTLLHRIRNQHRDLERSLDRFMKYLDDATEKPEWHHPYLTEAICLRARVLRYTLAVHSDDERRFFQEVIDE